MNLKRALVAGAGGFIGGHLVKRLLEDGYELVIAVDSKPLEEWHQPWEHSVVVNYPLIDLRDFSNCFDSVQGVDEVYNLAADMGGMGFIENNKLDCMLSVLINTNLLRAAVTSGVRKYFFASSACVYPGYKQNNSTNFYKGKEALKESEAYPADPEDGYGWEKLFSERMCRHFFEERGLEVRIARYHNVFGPHGSWKGGREKAPAALCRKVAEAEITGSHAIEIWGDGKQTRSFMFIDDCIEGTRRLMESDWTDPINLGSMQLVTVDQLADLVEDAAGVLRGESPVMRYERSYNLDAPQGVRGRNSDNTLIKQVLRWEPQESLAADLIPTYEWIYKQVKEDLHE